MKQALIETLGGAGITVGDQDAERMAEYWRFLKETNEHMNLTAVVSDEEAALKHFADSLAPLKFGLPPVGASVIDVGSGAGFPGMPLAIARPDLDVTLLDSLGKRVKFLSQAAALTNTRLNTIHARAEEAARTQLREAFDVAAARAVAPLNVLVELCMPFVRVGGCLMAYKGAAAQDELSAAQRAIRELGGGEARIQPCGLPGRESCLVIIQKQRPTPKRYPRRPGEAARMPLANY